MGEEGGLDVVPFGSGEHQRNLCAAFVAVARLPVDGAAALARVFGDGRSVIEALAPTSSTQARAA